MIFKALLLHTYHLLMRVAGSGTLSIGIRGDDTVTGIKAVCTYL